MAKKFTQNPKRKVAAGIALIALTIGFYFFYDYATKSLSAQPGILFFIFGFSIILLLFPLLFEPYRPPKQEKTSVKDLEFKTDKPVHPILRNCIRCGMVLPGHVTKCPSCGANITGGFGDVHIKGVLKGKL